MRRGIKVAVVGLAVLAASAAGRVPVGAATARPTVRPVQTPEQRAVVVVDTGSMVRTVCIRFREGSISGTEALRRAGMSPVLRSFGGQGAAVCSLCGQGCPADGTCLSCGGADYWSYFRGSTDSGGFAYSRAGAGSVQVRDGDVEGWKWGNGSAAPAFSTVESVCGPIATVIPSTIVPGAAAPSPAAGSAADPAPVATPSSPGGNPTSEVGPAAPAPQVGGIALSRNDAVTRSAAPRVRSGSGGSPIMIAVVGGIALGLVVGLLVSRRRRIGSAR